MRRLAVLVGLITASAVFALGVWGWNAYVSRPDPARIRQGETTREPRAFDTLGSSPTTGSGCLYEGPNRLLTLQQRAGQLGLKGDRVPLDDIIYRFPKAHLPRETLGGALRVAFAESLPETETVVLYFLYDNGIEIRQRPVASAPDYRGELARIEREQAAVPAAKNADTKLVRIDGRAGLATPAAPEAVASACADPNLGELRFWDGEREYSVVGYRRNLDELVQVAESL